MAVRRKNTRSRLQFVAIAFFATGCTAIHLRHSTLKQAETITDLHYQQVLNNLAMLKANPAALPYFAVPTAGTAGITSTVNSGVTLDYSRVRFEKWGLGFTGARSEAENWSLQPVNDPNRLMRMRCAYQIALGVHALPPKLGCDPGCYQCTKLLKDMGLLTADECFHCDKECDPACEHKCASACSSPENCKYNKSLHCNAPTCWFGWGRKKEVPRDACYVGHYGDIYVWVCPNQLDELTRFSLTILSLATSDPPAPNAEIVRTLDSDGRVKEYRVTTRENIKLTKVPTMALMPSFPMNIPLLMRVPQTEVVEPSGEPVSPSHQDRLYDPFRGLILLQQQER